MWRAGLLGSRASTTEAKYLDRSSDWSSIAAAIDLPLGAALTSLSIERGELASWSNHDGAYD